ncbi:MAG: polysaccharide deacetylase family protein [Candidatus Omnitrophica bacterium]|nr:polysaccharide deacetylase family protein [Candidatus Omnitrophota bacterium]
MASLVLMYHNVVRDKENLDIYDVSLDSFIGQMEVISRREYKMNAPLDIIITFDDGYKSWAEEVLDILRKLGLTAYFFVSIEFIRRGMISKEEIIRLNDNGMVIGSHGVFHRFFFNLSNEDLFYELGESKKILEDILGKEVIYFSVPRGIYNKKLEKIAQDVGYRRIFTSLVGINDKDDFVVKRVPVKSYTSLSDFKKILDGKIKFIAFSQNLKDKAKVILGINSYNYLRTLFTPGGCNEGVKKVDKWYGYS